MNETPSTAKAGPVETQETISMKSYSYSTDEERFHGSFPTPEQAAHEGFVEEYEWGDSDANTIWVGENEPPIPPENYIDTDLLIEHVQCQEDYSGEWAEDWPGSTKEQKDELTEEIRKTFAAWIEKHALAPTHFSVKNVRTITREECGFVIPRKAPSVIDGNEVSPAPLIPERETTDEGIS